MKPELSAASIISGGTVSSPSNMTSFLTRSVGRHLIRPAFVSLRRQTCHKELVCVTFENDCRPFCLGLCSIFHKSLFLWCITGETSHSSLSPLPSLLLGESLPAGVWRTLGQAALGHLLELDLQRFLLEINSHL